MRLGYFLLFAFYFFMDMGVIIFSLYTVNGVSYDLGQSIQQFNFWKDSTRLADAFDHVEQKPYVLFPEGSLHVWPKSNLP